MVIGGNHAVPVQGGVGVAKSLGSAATKPLLSSESSHHPHAPSNIGQQQQQFQQEGPPPPDGHLPHHHHRMYSNESSIPYHSSSGSSPSSDFDDDDDGAGSLTRQLAETAVGVREMSKQLGKYCKYSRGDCGPRSFAWLNEWTCILPGWHVLCRLELNFLFVCFH